MTFVIGHVPLEGTCMSCGLDGNGECLPLEPCPDQAHAHELCEHGYAPLPSSLEQIKALLGLARES